MRYTAAWVIMGLGLLAIAFLFVLAQMMTVHRGGVRKTPAPITAKADVAPPSPIPEPEATPARSGRLVAGVRVVRITVRRFACDPAKIVVNQGDKVRLELAGADVRHEVKIDGLGVNRVIEPGKTEVIEFTADKSGTFLFRCSAEGDAGRGKMRGEIVVLPAAT
jgi:heme/copper-type cytochrome/quinol oxidase subunit 2